MDSDELFEKGYETLNDAILKAGVDRESKSSTADSSKGVEKIVISIFEANLKSSSCHSKGVEAS